MGKSDILVRSRVVQSHGAPLRADWRLTNRDGTICILDLSVEGISMALTSDWDNQWLTGGAEPDVIAEAQLDAESIFAGIKRFADERAQRLGHQRELLTILG